MKFYIRPTSLDFGDSWTFAGRGQRRSGFVRLTRRSVKGHDPQVRFGLIVCCKHDAIAFLDGVKKKSTAVQICTTKK